ERPAGPGRSGPDPGGNVSRSRRRRARSPAHTRLARGVMRFLRAFAWLRWRLLANSLRAAESRDVLERVSRVTALIAPGFLLATSVSSVVAAIVLGTAGGWISVTYRFQSSWVL